MADQMAPHLTQTRSELAARDTALAEPCRHTREQASEIALSRQVLDRAAQGQSTTGEAARAEIETLRNDLPIAQQTADAAMQRCEQILILRRELRQAMANLAAVARVANPPAQHYR